MNTKHCNWPTVCSMVKVGTLADGAVLDNVSYG